MFSRLAKLTPFLLVVACYHATVETGLTPSAEVIDKSFASSWIYGLVPPSTVSTASQCHSGVARVETQLSFVNGLVGLLTLGIYTPMAIKVTCAAAGAAASSTAPGTLSLRGDSPSTLYQSVFALAADRSVADGSPILVHIVAPVTIEHR